MKSGSGLSRRRLLAQGMRSAAAAAVAPAFAGGFSAQAAVQKEPPATQAGADDNKATPAPPPHVTRIIADWVAASRLEEIPAEVRKEAVRSVVNCVGATLGGSSDQTVTLALRALQPFSGSPPAALLGRNARLDPPRAALINGISSHVLDYDDTELNTIIHPAGVVASALFALSAAHPFGGAEFLHAFVLGTEVECRLGNAIYPSHYEMGWHITATCGVFGAAAACGKIMGLTSTQMTYALGIAATQASGLKVMFGSMCKSFQVGRAAESGLMAALLAQQGFTSSDVPLEGADGYIQAASREHDYSQLTMGLGEHYEIRRNTYKPFPCGIVLHPVIDGSLQLRKENQLAAQDVASIVVRANPLILELTGKTDPATGLEGKFSVYHSVAIALVRGKAGMAEYSDAAVRDPQVVALRSRVKVVTDPSIRSDEAYLVVTTRDGRTLSKHVEHAIGSTERPMSNADLEEKFRGLASLAIPGPQAEKVLAMCWDLEKLPDISLLPAAGAASAGARPV